MKLFPWISGLGIHHVPRKLHALIPPAGHRCQCGCWRIPVSREWTSAIVDFRQTPANFLRDLRIRKDLQVLGILANSDCGDRGVSQVTSSSTSPHKCTRCYLSLRQVPRYQGSVADQLTNFVYTHSPSLCLKTSAVRCTALRASCQIRYELSDFRVRIASILPKVFLSSQSFLRVFFNAFVSALLFPLSTKTVIADSYWFYWPCKSIHANHFIFILPGLFRHG